MTGETSAPASAGNPSPAVPAGPQRTCIGCRSIDAQSALTRLALQMPEPAGSGADDIPLLVIDTGRGMPGRGAWIHPRWACFDAAIRKRAGHRAMRQPVDYRFLTQRLGRMAEEQPEDDTSAYPARKRV